MGRALTLEIYSWNMAAFLYDSDSYSDDRPYWIEIAQKKHLVIPYSLVCNDANFLRGSLGTGQDFFVYLKDTFDMLYRESQERASMMSIGLHPRVIGQPGRALGLLRFIEMLSSIKMFGYAVAPTSQIFGTKVIILVDQFKPKGLT